MERYNTPNHPRWYPSAADASEKNQMSRPRYGRRPENEHRPERTTLPEPPLLLSRDATGDETTIELRETSDRVWISTELPDCSLDDVVVSVSGTSVRIRTDLSDCSSPGDGIDRTITFADTVDAAGVAVAYQEPTLTVIVPNEDR